MSRLVIIIDVKKSVVILQIIVDRLGLFPESRFAFPTANDGGHRIEKIQKGCSVLLFSFLGRQAAAPQQKAENKQKRQYAFHYFIAFAIRAWKPPMAMVTEALRSASAGLVVSVMAMPATSAAVLPVT